MSKTELYIALHTSTEINPQGGGVTHVMELLMLVSIPQKMDPKVVITMSTCIRYSLYVIRFALRHRRDSTASTLRHLNVNYGGEQII